VEPGQFFIKGYDGPVLQCDKCEEEMQLRSGRFGKYFACTAEECKNTRKLLRNGEPAPPKVDPIPMPDLACEKCEDFYLLRDGAAGIFLAASQFPKHRETRAPLVDEIRFLRKTKEQYVMTEVDGKASGWRAYYRDGKWVEEQPPPSGSKKKAAKSKKKAAGRKKKAAKRKKSASRKKSAARKPD
jgi:DNA topoisomerase-1